MAKLRIFILVFLGVVCFSSAQAQNQSTTPAPELDEIDFSLEDPSAIPDANVLTAPREEQPAPIENLLDEPTPSRPQVAETYHPRKESGEISVEQKENPNEPYRMRRGRFGSVLSFNYEKFLPTDYYSLIQDKYYDEILGTTPISVFGAEFGIKYNFVMGSITALVGYAAGSVNDTSKGVDSMKISITKAAANFALDALMNEPWIVPYGQVGIHQFSWTESSLNGSSELEEESSTSNWNLSYKAGVMFQLNWLETMIDTTTHEQGLRSSGLENTFLDVFYSVYSRPQKIADGNNDDGEADLSSAQLGVGLKLEF